MPLTMRYSICITIAVFICTNNLSSIKLHHAGHMLPQQKPGPRVLHSLVYDATAEATLLLDGYHLPQNPEFGELWQWNGEHWKKTSEKATPVCFGSAAAYDAKRKKLIVFGGLHARGSEEGKLLNETWQYDGKQWSRLNVAGPQPRFGHAMVYDSNREKIILFGGSPGFQKEAFGDTWEWDGTAWKKINVEGPAARADFAMVYDSRIKKVILFGGQGKKLDEEPERKDLNDTWSWDGRKWEKINEAGPGARIRHKMVYDGKSGLTILYGGDRKNQNNNSGIASLDDMWTWNGSEWKEIKKTNQWPGKRMMHAMAYDEARNKTILYSGGNGEIIIEDTWEWDGKEWKKISW